MKDRQRWQPEEDTLLREYVNQYGPKEWNLVSQRMSKTLDRDAKSCLERWKNYLKPGIKKGSLTPEEQNLVISLQAKYGNKWKKIASEVPGRTAKRLGKWWEVFKEKQIKNQHKNQQKQQRERDSTTPSSSSSVHAVTSPEKQAFNGKYDHILETFAEKYVQPSFLLSPPLLIPNLSLSDSSPILSLGGGSISDSCETSVLPPWMNTSSSSPSVSLSLSPSEPIESVSPSIHQIGLIFQWCKELEEGRNNLLQHKKEASWRLNRLEQQLESEKARKRREKMEEVEGKIRCLREEEMAFFDEIEMDCREKLNVVQRDVEMKEVKLMEILASKHYKLTKIVEQFSSIHQ